MRARHMTLKPTGTDKRTADKIHLVSVLWEHLVGMEGSPWTALSFLQ